MLLKAHFLIHFSVFTGSHSGAKQSKPLSTYSHYSHYIHIWALSHRQAFSTTQTRWLRVKTECLAPRHQCSTSSLKAGRGWRGAAATFSGKQPTSLEMELNEELLVEKCHICWKGPTFWGKTWSQGILSFDPDLWGLIGFWNWLTFSHNYRKRQGTLILKVQADDGQWPLVTQFEIHNMYQGHCQRVAIGKWHQCLLPLLGLYSFSS